MKAILISYTLEKSNATQKRAITRALYGYKDISCNGKYKYERKGILDGLDYIKPQKSVLIVKNKDKNIILDILIDQNATIQAFNINIDSKYFKK